MNKTVRLVIILYFTVYSFNSVFAQDYSVSLSGTFQLDTRVKEGMYDALVFDGAGKVGIHPFGESKWDFLQVGDTVVIYPDKSLFTFLVRDENTLDGIDTWVKGQVFRRMDNDTIVAPAYSRKPEYGAQFYKFYTLTGGRALDLSTYMKINADPEMNASMRRLCDEGFGKACITMANALMMNSPVLASLFSDFGEEKNYRPDKEIVDFYIKAVELDEPDGIGQLGAYFLLLGNMDEAVKIFEKGCELGYNSCCLSLLSIQLMNKEQGGDENGIK